MKRSELRQLIKEELGRLDESNVDKAYKQISKIISGLSWDEQYELVDKLKNVIKWIGTNKRK